MATESQQTRIEMLGGLRVVQRDRVETQFETRKAAALLAYLALRLGRPQPRNVVAERLWPDDDPEAVGGRFRQALSSLRRTLAGTGEERCVLQTDRMEVTLAAGAATTDVIEFEEELRRAGQAHDDGSLCRHLRAAIELYRGELLPGYQEDWIVSERDRLGEAYRSALGRLARLMAEVGDLGEAIEVAMKAVAADPLREDAHCDLMGLYIRAGRPGDALRQYRELARVLRQELALEPSDTARRLIEQIRSSREATPGPSGGPPATAESAVVDLEAEGGAVPLDSRYYVARPTDFEFAAAILRKESLVLVKGPRQIGKTSLLARGLQRAREAGAKVVLTDLQKLTGEQLAGAEPLFLTLAESISDQLDLVADTRQPWGEVRGWNVGFERFMRKQILSPPGTHVVWGLDEVDRLFGRPYGSEVFGLFRSWHNERSLDPSGPWSRLTLALAYATEAHLFITDLNQSPFNVGTRVVLGDFTRGEVADLNERYGSPLADREEVKRFCRLVGGHPYMVRRGLHEMACRGVSVDDLEASTNRGEGPFHDHLLRVLAALSRNEGLVEAVAGFLQGTAAPTAEVFWRLRSAGVFAGDSPSEARFRCGLYEAFLARHLG